MYLHYCRGLLIGMAYLIFGKLYEQKFAKLVIMYNIIRKVNN